MSQTTYGYHLGGQRIVAIFLFLYMSTLLIDMNGKHAFTNLTKQVPYANSEQSPMLQIVIICAITRDFDNICSGRET